MTLDPIAWYSLPNTGFHFHKDFSVFVLVMLFINIAGGTTCSKGHYLLNTDCVPCDRNFFMDSDNHTHEACIQCTTFNKIIDYVLEVEICTNVSNTKIAKCIDGYYIKDDECRMCPLCNTGNDLSECCETNQISTATPAVYVTTTPLVNLNVTVPGNMAHSSTGVSSSTDHPYRQSTHDITIAPKSASDDVSLFILTIVLSVVILIVILVFLAVVYYYKRSRTGQLVLENGNLLIEAEEDRYSFKNNNDVVTHESETDSINMDEAQVN